MSDRTDLTNTRDDDVDHTPRALSTPTAASSAAADRQGRRRRGAPC